MAEELLITPEITMHEEPGEIRINQGSGEVAVEIDDDEPPSSSAYDIPADISITRVNKSVASKPMLKVRSDLSRFPLHHGGLMAGQHPSIPSMARHSRPPPLIRAGAPIPGLPPMPRLKLGASRPPMSRMHHPMGHPQPPQNPLVGMFNMIPSNSVMGPRTFVPAPPSQMLMAPPPRARHPMNQHHQPPTSIHNGNNRGGLPPSSISPGTSLLRPPQHQILKTPPSQQQPQSVTSKLRQIRSVRIPQEPLPCLQPKAKEAPPKPAPQVSTTIKPTTVQVPPPLRGNEIASKVLQNGGSYSFPGLNVTVTSAPKKPKAQALVELDEEEEEIDDAEEEELEEELDDVEPTDGATNGEQTCSTTKTPSSADQSSGTPTSVTNRKPDLAPPADEPPPKVAISPRRKIGTLKFVRTADGKGYMRRQTDQLLQKAKATASKFNSKKKKKRFFRGANYRFDGSSIKRKARPNKALPVIESVGSQLTAGILNQDGAEVPVAGENNFLSYLGIQRKGSEEAEALSESEENAPKKVAQKAKKSFRPSGSSPTSNAAFVNERTTSYDASSVCSTDSLTMMNKRRLDDPSTPMGAKRPRVDEEGSSPTKLLRPLLPLATEFEEKPLSRTRPKDAKPLPEPSNKIQPNVCECNQAIAVSESLEETPECQAVETVGVSRVGCKNKVNDQNFQRRATEKLPKLYLCDLHIERMKGHQVCGFCGEFGAHGVFMMCRPFTKSEPHLFHKSCFNSSQSKSCPHCHSTEKPLTVLLKLTMDRVPLSLLQTVSKMSFVKSKKTKMSDLILQGRNESTVEYKLPNGNTISSEGLPDGLTDENLEKVIAAVEDKDKLKHTTRNMLTPTKLGDTVKILQLLSLGYSPKQKFTEAENGTPLHVAASEGHVLTSHVLVQAGAELDAIDDEQNTPLMKACVEGKSNVVKYLLAAGADLTLRGDDGMTCLHLAAQSGHLDCVQVIMSQNNLPRKFINLQDEGGWTPLVWACENKHEEVISYLLECGADPLITDAEGNIALHWAALSGSHRTCEKLLNHGCDVNATNSIGETPIHIALRQDHYECVMLFLMRRARMDVVNKNGQKPVDCMMGKAPKCASIVKLTTTIQELMSNAPKNRLERIICNDLTHGKETNSIQCVNDLDDENEPKNYVYVKSNVVTTSIPLDRNIATLQHCKCTDDCTTEDTCNCSDLSVKSWYDLQGRLKEGFDYKEPPMIFECNDLCGCNVSSCHNRVLQHGITVRLQVFRPFGMGWGVRPLTDVPRGTFVCEYVGELISDSEAETREDSYLFDLDNKDGDTFCIDANNYGNVTRFINHSCQPNLTPVKVFASHQDLRFPHIALFANRDIKKGEELGFDYGEKFWVIKHKFFTCHCASEKCRYSKSNINTFLREYYKRNGEPCPPELEQAPNAPGEVNGSKNANEIKLELQEAETGKKIHDTNGKKATGNKSSESDKKANKKARSESPAPGSSQGSLKTSPTIVIPLTKVNVKALNDEEQTNNANKLNGEIKKEPNLEVNSRPRRSVTRKNDSDSASTK